MYLWGAGYRPLQDLSTPRKSGPVLGAVCLGVVKSVPRIGRGSGGGFGKCLTVFQWVGWGRAAVLGQACWDGPPPGPYPPFSNRGGKHSQPQYGSFKGESDAKMTPFCWTNLRVWVKMTLWTLKSDSPKTSMHGSAIMRKKPAQP